MAYIVQCNGHYHDLAASLGECCPCCLGFHYTDMCQHCHGAGTLEKPALPRINNSPSQPLVRCTPCNGRGFKPLCKEALEQAGFRFLVPLS